MKSFIQHIFSIKNDKQYKVLRLFGVKLKTTRSKYLKNEIDKLNKKIKGLQDKNKYYQNAIKSNPEMFEIYIKNPELEKKDNERAPIVRQKIEEWLSVSPPPPISHY